MGFKSENIISDSNGTRTGKHIARNTQPFLDIKSLKTSDIASFSSNFFDIQTTIQCRFTLKHVHNNLQPGNIAVTNTTHATKILWIALEQDCNMYAITPLWKLRLHTVMSDKSLFGLTMF